MSGKRVRIEASGLGWVLVAECLPTSIRLTSGAPADGGSEPTPDAGIAGSLMSLAALAGAHPEEVIRRGDVTIRGAAPIATRTPNSWRRRSTWCDITP